MSYGSWACFLRCEGVRQNGHHWFGQWSGQSFRTMKLFTTKRNKKVINITSKEMKISWGENGPLFFTQKGIETVEAYLVNE